MTQEREAARAQESEKTAGLAGTGAGVVAGAQLGTVLLPIPVVGTFTGALVGGIIGSKIGKRVGGVLRDTVGAGSPCAKPDVMRELERLGRLREQGVLTEEEFRAAKARLLDL